MRCFYFNKTIYGMAFYTYTQTSFHEKVGLIHANNFLEELSDLIKYKIKVDDSLGNFTQSFDITQYYAFKNVLGKSILQKRMFITDFESKFRNAIFEEALMLLEKYNEVRSYKEYINFLKVINPEEFI